MNRAVWENFSDIHSSSTKKIERNVSKDDVNSITSLSSLRLAVTEKNTNNISNTLDKPNESHNTNSDAPAIKTADSFKKKMYKFRKSQKPSEEDLRDLILGMINLEV